MLRWVAAIACCILIVCSVPAFSRSFVILGGGTESCGTWTKERRHRDLASYVLESWVLGYISAINVHVLKNSEDISAGTNNEGLLGWMDNYCQEHPLDEVRVAADALIVVLVKRSGAS